MQKEQSFHEIVKEVLGSKYSPKIIDYLNKKGVKNSKGLPFSVDSIFLIVKKENNELVQDHIAKLIAITKAKSKKAAEKRNQLISN